MTTGVLPDYTPVTPPAYYQPVQDESPNLESGLCGCPLPNGKGLLVWTYNESARFAVTDSTSAWLTNDIVPLADMDTITSVNVRSVSCYTIGGEVYATVVRLTSHCVTTIWQANDALDPYAGWTQVGSVQVALAPGTLFGMLDWAAGIPMELPSGRWVMASAGWQDGLGPGEGASGSAACAWYSDNGAAGPWTITVNWAHLHAGFSRLEYCSNQLGRDPITGYLYFSSSGAGGNDNTRLWWSQDDGGSFTVATQGFILDVPRIAGFVNNGTTLYSVDDDGPATISYLDGPGDDYASWASTTQAYSPVANGDQATFRAVVVTGEGLYYFWEDKVSFVPVNITDFTFPLLHIPFKDRLVNVRYQPTPGT